MGVDDIMASFKIKGFNNDIDILSRLGASTEGACKTAVGAGARILFGEVKKRLNSSISKGATERAKHHRKLTGGLENALGITKVEKDKNGVWNSKIGFPDGAKGYDAKGRPYQVMARAMESGTSRGQQKRPFVRPAVNASKQRVQDEMKKVIDKYYQDLERK